MHDAIEIYNKILDKNLKRFPRNFWNDKEKSNLIFKYLIDDILHCNNEQIFNNFNYKIIVKYKLTSPFEKFYNKSISNLLNEIYPNLIQGKRLPVAEKTKNKISIAQKNLSKEKREKITKGARENRYCKEYAKKLSDTKLGELNPRHKLIESQVIEIRRLWETKIYTAQSLGDKFGVKRQTITDIVYGRTWKYLK